MTRSAELIERYGTCSEHLSAWVRDGILRVVDGGGSGTRFEFDQVETLALAAVMTWRAAVPGAPWEVLAAIARAVRDQYPTGPPAETTASLVVTVDLAPGVHVILEVEP